MSSISKLNIVGVRSFDPKGTGQNIDFKTPLTLIVGDNGSGKTTIIESLKYASTGEFPPGAGKTGAFIHDPKLTQADEVLAQVKMKFHNSQGLTYVASRRLSCVVKKGGGYTQKQIDQSITMKRLDDKQTISTTVEKMNNMVPAYMGVSSAILQNVIFCHQDDSLWPMSEPKFLKEKFDKIFEAEKYTKAIDSLIKARKLRTGQAKVLEVEEKNAKENFNRSKRAKQKMIDLLAAIESKRADITDLEKEIALAEEAFKVKYELMSTALGAVNTLENHRQQVANIQYNIKSLEENMKVREESTEWLKSTLAEFDKEMEMYRQQANNLRKQYDSNTKSLTAKQAELSARQRDKGEYTAQMKQHEADLQTRAELVKDAAFKHSLRGYDGDLDEDMIQQFIARVEGMYEAKERELALLKETTSKEAKEHLSVMTTIQQRIASRQQERSTAKTQIATNKRLADQKQSEIDEIDMDEVGKANLDNELRDAKQRFKNANAAFEQAGWSKRLASEKKHLAELEAELERLREELMQRTKTMKDSAALDLAREAAQQAESSLKTVLDAYRDRLDEFIGSNWTSNNIQREYDAALTRVDRRISDAAKAKAKADREYHEHSTGLQRLKADLAKKNEEVQRCNTAVLESILTPDGKPITSVGEYLHELKVLEQERDEAQGDLSGISHMSEYYKKALDVINTKNCCRLCERGFANTNEKRSATDKVNRLIEKYVKEKLEQDLQVIIDDLKKAQNARPLYDTWKRLVEIEIPGLQKDIQDMESKSQSFQSQCDQQDEKHLLAETEKKNAKSLQKPVLDIAKLNSEILAQNEKANRLSSQQKLSASSMTLEEIEEQQLSCNEKIRSAKSKIDKISADRDSANTELTDLERNVGVIATKVNSAQHDLEKKQALSDAVKSLEDNTAQQRELIKNADKDVQSLGPELEKEKEQRDDVLRRGDVKAAELHADKTKLGVTEGNLRSIEQNIRRYVDSGGPHKLAACDRDISTLQEQLARLETERIDLTAKNNSIKDLVSNSENTKRDITANLSYRKLSRDREELERKIADLEARDTEREHRRLDREQKAANNHMVQLSAERTKLETQMLTEDNQYQALVEEWNTEYADIADTWRQFNIKYQTTKAVVDDLTKCTQALDQAIIAFHTRKMEDVNSIAAELWRDTYQGTDVETIMIKSEPDKAVPATNANGRRAFNYRLVMVKGDAELDMRARCSAGQRVLACIIIRLALAESFGANCGVIALDEPTTNLDTDNIKALARSLHQIIQNRKHQKNFQLIVITHDEAFIREMKCKDFTEDYYRVSRNADQTSKIMRQSLNNIDED